MSADAELPQIPSHWGPVLEVTNTGTHDLVMSECRFEFVGHRLFMVGLKHERSQTAGEPGPRYAIAWDSVTAVMSFNSLADYATLHKQRQEFYQSFDEKGNIPF